MSYVQEIHSSYRREWQLKETKFKMNNKFIGYGNIKVFAAQIYGCITKGIEDFWVFSGWKSPKEMRYSGFSSEKHYEKQYQQK